MNESLVKQLLQFGLSEKESKIYLALLELEAATVFETAKHSGINRSSAYVVLESLKKKGLVGISDDKKVRQYVAASPDTLLQEAREAIIKTDTIKNSIEGILPELKALHKGTKRRPIVKIFEGENGSKEVYQDLFMTNAKEIKVFADPVKIFKHHPDFLQWFDRERGKRNIKLCSINPLNEEVETLYKYTKPAKPYEVIFIPEKEFKFSSDLGIYANRSAFVSPKDGFGIIIESAEIANMLTNTFNLLWKLAKKTSKIKSFRG